MGKQLIKALFYLSAAYDGALGLLFIFAPALAFDYFHVALPNHFGYVQFPAALLLIFAVMFLEIARHPHESRNLIPYCILLKVAYCGVTGAYWFKDALPDMWKIFFVCDFIFAILYVCAYKKLGSCCCGGKEAAAGTTGGTTT
jgi:hypothetical protein